MGAPDFDAPPAAYIGMRQAIGGTMGSIILMVLTDFAIPLGLLALFGGLAALKWPRPLVLVAMMVGYWNWDAAGEIADFHWTLLLAR